MSVVTFGVCISLDDSLQSTNYSIYICIYIESMKKMISALDLITIINESHFI